jgi:hypothetical protein
MTPLIRPAALRLLAAFLAWYYRGEERGALRDLADDRRHVEAFRAVVSACDATAREPTVAVGLRALATLGEALLHDHGAAHNGAVLLAGIRAAERMLRFRHQHASAGASPETVAEIARDASAELDVYEDLAQAYDHARDAGGSGTPAPEDTWEGEGGAVAATTER